MRYDGTTIKKTLLSLLVLLIVGYTGFNSRFLLQGPEIELEHPEETVTTDDNTFYLRGKVLHSSFISVNGRPIFIDEAGNFSEKLLLSSGISIIDIYAKDKFGKETRKKIDVLYHGNAQPVDLAQASLAASGTASTTGLAAASEIAQANPQSQASGSPALAGQESAQAMRMSLMQATSTATSSGF